MPHEDCNAVEVLVIDPLNGELGSTNNEEDQSATAAHLPNEGNGCNVNANGNFTDIKTESDAHHPIAQRPTDWDNVSVSAIAELEMMKEDIECELIEDLEKFGHLLNLEHLNSGRDNHAMRDEIEKLVSAIQEEIDDGEEDDEDYCRPPISDCNEVYDYWKITSNGLIWSPPSSKGQDQSRAHDANDAAMKVENCCDSATRRVTFKSPILENIKEDDERGIGSIDNEDSGDKYDHVEHETTEKQNKEEKEQEERADEELDNDTSPHSSFKAELSEQETNHSSANISPEVYQFSDSLASVIIAEVIQESKSRISKQEISGDMATGTRFEQRDEDNTSTPTPLSSLETVTNTPDGEDSMVTKSTAEGDPEMNSVPALAISCDATINDTANDGDDDVKELLFHSPSGEDDQMSGTEQCELSRTKSKPNTVDKECTVTSSHTCNPEQDINTSPCSSFKAELSEQEINYSSANVSADINQFSDSLASVIIAEVIDQASENESSISKQELSGDMCSEQKKKELTSAPTLLSPVEIVVNDPDGEYSKVTESAAESDVEMNSVPALGVLCKATTDDTQQMVANGEDDENDGDTKLLIYSKNGEDDQMSGTEQCELSRTKSKPNTVDKECTATSPHTCNPEQDINTSPCSSFKAELSEQETNHSSANVSADINQFSDSLASVIIAEVIDQASENESSISKQELSGDMCSEQKKKELTSAPTLLSSVKIVVNAPDGEYSKVTESAAKSDVEMNSVPALAISTTDDTQQMVANDGDNENDGDTELLTYSKSGEDDQMSGTEQCEVSRTKSKPNTVDKECTVTSPHTCNPEQDSNTLPCSSFKAELSEQETNHSSPNISAEVYQFSNSLASVIIAEVIQESKSRISKQEISGDMSIDKSSEQKKEKIASVPTLVSSTMTAPDAECSTVTKSAAMSDAEMNSVPAPNILCSTTIDDTANGGDDEEEDDTELLFYSKNGEEDQFSRAEQCELSRSKSKPDTVDKECTVTLRRIHNPDRTKVNFDDLLHGNNSTKAEKSIPEMLPMEKETPCPQKPPGKRPKTQNRQRSDNCSKEDEIWKWLSEMCTPPCVAHNQSDPSEKPPKRYGITMENDELISTDCTIMKSSTDPCASTQNRTFPPNVNGQVSGYKTNVSKVEQKRPSANKSKAVVPAEQLQEQSLAKRTSSKTKTLPVIKGSSGPTSAKPKKAGLRAKSAIGGPVLPSKVKKFNSAPAAERYAETNSSTARAISCSTTVDDTAGDQDKQDTELLLYSKSGDDEQFSRAVPCKSSMAKSKQNAVDKEYTVTFQRIRNPDRTKLNFEDLLHRNNSANESNGTNNSTKAEQLIPQKLSMGKVSPSTQTPLLKRPKTQRKRRSDNRSKEDKVWKEMSEMCTPTGVAHSQSERPATTYGIVDHKELISTEDMIRKISTYPCAATQKCASPPSINCPVLNEVQMTGNRVEQKRPSAEQRQKMSFAKLPNVNVKTPPVTEGLSGLTYRDAVSMVKSSIGGSVLPPKVKTFCTSMPLFKGYGIRVDEPSWQSIPQITWRGSEYGFAVKTDRHQSDVGRVPQPLMTPPEIFSLPKIPLTSDGQGYDATAWIRANRDTVKQIYAKHATDHRNSTSKMEWSSSDKGHEKLPEIVQPENRSLPVVPNGPYWF